MAYIQPGYHPGATVVDCGARYNNFIGASSFDVPQIGWNE